MEVPFSVGDLLGLLTFTLVVLFFLLIATHLVSNLFLANSPAKLTNNSFLVITGGCMGLGRQMAIEAAKVYHCTILIVDFRKDLFDDVHEVFWPTSVL